MSTDLRLFVHFKNHEDRRYVLKSYEALFIKKDSENDSNVYFLQNS